MREIVARSLCILEYVLAAKFPLIILVWRETYVRQRLDELVDVGLLGRPLDLILGHDPAVVSIGDVLGDAAVKQDGLLGHNA